MATVVGDVVGYTALAERDGEDAAAAAVDEVFASLGHLLVAHGATTSHREGDSLFAAWDVSADPRAADMAVCFALAAAQLVDDAALQMGWASRSAVRLPRIRPRHGTRSTPTRSTSPFRLSGLAARGGEPPVLVGAEAASAAGDAADPGDLREIALRGRTAPVRVQAAANAA